MDACIRRMPDGRSLSCGRLHTMGKAGGEAHGCGEGGNENDTGIMQSGKKNTMEPSLSWRILHLRYRRGNVSP